MAGPTFDIADETNPTAIFFIGGVVEPLFGGEVAIKCYRHILSRIFLRSKVR
jgi:hypothetical protein